MISWHRRRKPRGDGAWEDSGAGVDGRSPSRARASVEPQADAPGVFTDGGGAGDGRETKACRTPARILVKNSRMCRTGGLKDPATPLRLWRSYMHDPHTAQSTDIRKTGVFAKSLAPSPV